MAIFSDQARPAGCPMLLKGDQSKIFWLNTLPDSTQENDSPDNGCHLAIGVFWLSDNSQQSSTCYGVTITLFLSVETDYAKCYRTIGEALILLVLQLFLGPPAWPVPEENFWTLWCKGRLTQADTDHPAGRHSIRTNQCPPPLSPIFYRPDALPAAQPTVSKHWRQSGEALIIATIKKNGLPSFGKMMRYSVLHCGHRTFAVLLPRCFSSTHRCKHIWWTQRFVPRHRHGLTHNASRSSSSDAKQTQHVLHRHMYTRHLHSSSILFKRYTNRLDQSSVSHFFATSC